MTGEFTTKLMGLAVCFIFITAGQAGAFDGNHLQQLLQLRHCPGCDLSGVDLSGKDLSYHNLFKANLRGANLSNSNLTASSFVQADLRGANLSGAILDGANFSGATSWFDAAEICATPSIGGCFPVCPPGSTCY